ncbi:MAG: D-amino acid dehydrogenase [Rhodocyclaceae bacterium]|nr:D-amino acid dehydrogenase [Rhodocyclaceae bacterium]
MKVIILGAGLAGVCSAWYLARAGHQVSVLERRPAAGLETSFANGGQISVSHPEPWASPSTPWNLLRWLGRADAPIRFRLHRADAAQWRWALAFLRECSGRRSRRNTDAIARLGVASLHALRALRTELDLQYDQSARGILHLFFHKSELRAAAPRVALLASYGIEARLCDRTQCEQIEPALAATRCDIAGGIYAAGDESGDAHKFTQALAQACVARGVDFHYDTRIEGFDVLANTMGGVNVIDAHGMRGQFRADAFVCALGPFSALLAARYGERLPIYPVKGYSVTLPAAGGAPRVSITDESRRIVLSRLGDRLRIAGMAELDGFNLAVDPRRAGAILSRARELFPDCGNSGAAEYWAGLRPATPSNVPIIGASRIRNLYYNTGHGTLGWTLACGSAQLLAACLDQRAPEIDFPLWT